MEKFSNSYVFILFILTSRNASLPIGYIFFTQNEWACTFIEKKFKVQIFEVQDSPPAERQ